MRTLILLSSAALALAACASDPATGSGNNYESQLRRMTTDCQARGGILASTGQESGRPQNDNVCKINGEPSPLTRH